MGFKPGDKLLCIEAEPDGRRGLKKGRIYTFASWNREFNDLLSIKGNHYSWSKLRFILANDLSELERIIYGAIE